MKNWMVMYGQRRLLRVPGIEAPAGMTQAFEQLDDANAFVKECKADGLYAVLQPTPTMKQKLDQA